MDERRFSVTTLLAAYCMLNSLLFASFHRADLVWLAPVVVAVGTLYWLRRRNARVFFACALGATVAFGFAIGGPRPLDQGLPEGQRYVVLCAAFVLIGAALLIAAVDRSSEKKKAE